MATVCKSCGGPLTRRENYHICDFCGNKWQIDSGNDVHAVDRANAWSALRDGNFEKAAELFEMILAKEPKNHEAYWGRGLALAGIVYVTDLNENKKIPTCNNITEASFLRSKDVQKAISLAPDDIAEGYRQQAEYIDRVRLEWLEKASKEPAYDIFISYKDSDRENGLARTQDSIDAQDLYNALVAEGYKVFFSRVSLRDKISEQYEPYIYNAIRTAKVMIVFGEKAEYFHSVWIRNEWVRFKARIEKGEKHKNSLVTVYKNMNPGDLPVVLKSRQCLNAADMTFLSDLLRHIQRVVEESKRSVHLEKIEITVGQIAKKATALSVNSLRTRQIGAGAIVETSISEKQSISLIHTFLQEKQWQDAANLADDVLFNNPNCAEAIWCRLLSSHRCAKNDALVKALDGFSDMEFGSIEKILNCASAEFAGELLPLLYGSEKSVTGETYRKLLAVILPFSFQARQSCIRQAFEGVITHSKFGAFQLLLGTLEPGAVDAYIDYNTRYATAAASPEEKSECLQNVLSVDEGNPDALREFVFLRLENAEPVETVVQSLEDLLKYCVNPDDEVRNCLAWLHRNLSKATDCAFAKQLLRYYTADISTLKASLLKLSSRIISQGLFQEAEFFLHLILSFDPHQPDTYWNLCLMRIEATSEKEIPSKDKFLRDVPEFNRYLTLVNEARRKACIALSRSQLDARLQRIKAEAKTLVTEQTAPLAPLGYFMGGCGIFMAFAGLLLISMNAGAIWPFLVTVPELILACVFLRKKPSYAVVSENRRKKKALEEEIKELESTL